MCSNDNPGLTLTYGYFRGKVKFCNLGFNMGKCDDDADSLEIIAACDLDVS